MSLEFLGGWVDNPGVVEKAISEARIPFLSGASSKIDGLGKGKTVFLTKIYQALTGKPFPVLTQAIGDCTSFAAANALLALMASDIFVRGDFEGMPQELVATEFIYGASRVTIGGGIFRNQDGSTGSLTVEAMSRVGTLLRKKYGNIDLSNYSGSIAKQYGYYGPPKELLPIAKEHPVETYSLVKTYENARDVLAAGFPIIVCSNQGYSSVRDSEGFSRPQGSWPHALCACGIMDNDRRPGVLITNSWGGAWNSGPLMDGQIPGSFFVDADVFERYMLAAGDSWVISNFTGYPARDLSFDIFNQMKDKAKNYE